MSKQNEWQPIETAPTDGTELILFDGETVLRGKNKRFGSHSMWIGQSGQFSRTMNPRWWMPFPHTPADA